MSVCLLVVLIIHLDLHISLTMNNSCPMAPFIHHWKKCHVCHIWKNQMFFTGYHKTLIRITNNYYVINFCWFINQILEVMMRRRKTQFLGEQEVFSQANQMISLMDFLILHESRMPTLTNLQTWVIDILMQRVMFSTCTKAFSWKLKGRHPGGLSFHNIWKHFVAIHGINSGLKLYWANVETMNSTIIISGCYCVARKKPVRCKMKSRKV